MPIDSNLINDAILNNIPYLAWIKDKDGKYVAVNKAYCKLLNLKQEDIIGITDYDLYSKRFADKYRKDDIEVMKTGKQKRVEERIDSVKGLLWIETIKNPILDKEGNVIGSIGVANDVTEKKEANIKLLQKQEEILAVQKRENLLRGIVNTIRNTLDIKDMKKQIVKEIGVFLKVERCIIHQIDPKTGKFFIIDEFSEYRAVGEIASYVGIDIERPKLKFFKKMFLSKSEMIAPDFPKYLQGLKDVSQKSKKWIESLNIKSDYVFPIIYQGQMLATLYLTYTKEYVSLSEEDLSALRFIVNHIGIALNQAILYENEKNTSKNLMEKQQEIIELINQRNLFIATLTHDLRSPICAEQRALEAIILKKLGTKIDDFSEYLQDIYSTNEELLHLVNNLLSVFHLELGKFELNLNQHNLVDIINESVKSISYLAKEHGSDIIQNIEANLPLLEVDREQIFRVLTNLISNAIKHNKKGTEINIFVIKEDDNLQVSISDNGRGIPEEERANIFQRYPTKKRKIGTGLGLFLAKQLVEAHGGKIWFTSVEGKGTTFIFTLPLNK